MLNTKDKGKIIKHDILIIMVLLILILIIGIMLNFNTISFYMTKVNKDNYYYILATIDEKNISIDDKKYLKVALLYYPFAPEKTYNKTIFSLIQERKGIFKRNKPHST